MDYTSGPYTATFPAGTTSVTFDIPVNNDNILENSENVMLTINSSSLPDGVSRGNTDDTTVTILDYDCKQIYIR